MYQLKCTYTFEFLTYTYTTFTTNIYEKVSTWCRNYFTRIPIFVTKDVLRSCFFRRCIVYYIINVNVMTISEMVESKT